MAQVLKTKTQPSGTVGDVYQPGDGFLYRITQVFNAGSGLYEWSTERHNGVLMQSRSEVTGQLVAHGLTSGNALAPLTYNSGTLHMINWNAMGDYSQYCGVLKEVWNEYEVSVIPEGKTFSLPKTMIIEYGTAVSNSYSYSPMFEALEWHSVSGKYLMGGFLSPPPQQDKRDVSVYLNSKYLLFMWGWDQERNNAVCTVNTVTRKNPANWDASGTAPSEIPLNYMRPVYSFTQASPTGTWTINHPYHRQPYGIYLINLSGQMYKNFTVDLSTTGTVVINTATDQGGKAFLEFPDDYYYYVGTTL